MEACGDDWSDWLKLTHGNKDLPYSEHLEEYCRTLKSVWIVLLYCNVVGDKFSDLKVAELVLKDLLPRRVYQI